MHLKPRGTFQESCIRRLSSNTSESSTGFLGDCKGNIQISSFASGSPLLLQELLLERHPSLDKSADQERNGK